MFFASDNGGPVHPQIMQAIAAANDGHVLSYGNDPLTQQAVEMIRELFEAPEAVVRLVATGTAANALILSTMAQPWQTIFCTPLAHIHADECNAPELFTGGAKLTLTGTDGAKMTPDTLGQAITRIGWRGINAPQPGAVSLTQVTEMGTLYTLDELKALSAIARAHDLPVHLDGARFANACAALGCTAAEMTWKAGIDAVSFGGTKNGCMAVEAAVFFDPAVAREFDLRRKRGAHLFSKHRYLAAQMQGYLQDGLWLDLARMANERAAQLATGLRAAGVDFVCEPQANMIFARLPRSEHQRLMSGGGVYYTEDGDPWHGPDDEMLMGRFVCDWSVTEDDVDRFLQLVTG
ncbi:low specificity L-threonine aldolase [Ponticoccus sp. SC2-23]|uniref:threonine aldolase family protein n=1 Tax=Alexandriicola marinus TaxID=2081710 RepID=UPI000FD7C520|nr:low specificity L-threonine aldolase [Alexandriicola marinus]MBM1220076.1 low specificity L-threonine aldolase [Ponticoccus sp. SC6-9]MBM1224762.1 low specificity L-threonine aldolase [Ponticoccus sp. SC6-15]MBM1228275.1 low specificity L-threonine aldolase [Ponticoccus sp. SC6-38]MBM1234087.1 low specificity L-threonine aldolase [Ponticoccus sp. SC6-45]MBM1238777.1 low specificity L-threonine aldolase [Ponticoccus sp. SC6-49]MBM1242558.1 low specificity L-threonine aldolase [Ponticoccus s